MVVAVPVWFQPIIIILLLVMTSASKDEGECFRSSNGKSLSCSPSHVQHSKGGKSTRFCQDKKNGSIDVSSNWSQCREECVRPKDNKDRKVRSKKEQCQDNKDQIEKCPDNCCQMGKASWSDWSECKEVCAVTSCSDKTQEDKDAFLSFYVCRKSNNESKEIKDFLHQKPQSQGQHNRHQGCQKTCMRSRVFTDLSSTMKENDKKDEEGEKKVVYKLVELKSCQCGEKEEKGEDKEDKEDSFFDDSECSEDGEN